MDGELSGELTQGRYETDVEASQGYVDPVTYGRLTYDAPQTLTPVMRSGQHYVPVVGPGTTETEALGDEPKNVTMVSEARIVLRPNSEANQPVNKRSERQNVTICLNCGYRIL